MDLLVTLDNVAYEAKPSPQEFASITNRLKRAGATEIDKEGFCKHVGQCKTWIGAVYEPNGNGRGRFVCQQVFGLNFDNAVEVFDADGKPLKDANGHIVKRPLEEGENGYLDPLEALRRCYGNGLEPLCLYWTFSATLDPLHHRFRIVIAMDEPVTDLAKAEEILDKLLTLFPEADQKCRNVNRLFLGTPYFVTECWR